VENIPCIWVSFEMSAVLVAHHFAPNFILWFVYFCTHKSEDVFHV